MRILHLLSNKKWTERAEPATNLVLAQRQAGHDAVLACGRWTRSDGQERSVEAQARAKGLDPLVLDLTKHLNLSSAWNDIPRLREYIQQNRIEVVHAHMINAHMLAALACRRLNPRPLIFRSSYQADGPEGGLRSHILLRRFTDGLTVLSESARAATRRRFKLPADRIAAIEPGIDLEFFDPARPVNSSRIDFGLRASHFVIGMVTRIREDRRVDLVVKALHALAARAPDLVLLLAGHGEAEKEIRHLIERLGLQNKVFLPGYCREDRLVAAYRAMNVLVYPVPGTDPSCRTIREAMAAGRPAIVSRLGFLPELVEEKVTGRFMDLRVKSLAGVIEELYADRTGVSRMAEAALQTARRRFPLRLQADRTLAFYQTRIAG